ncbi:hypothetical protein B0A48_07749 [Cryoendolithus antarcticus]|uniref:Peptidase A1 domain-containing protein n=1 Tax=Cryoendolithus antarcticus TaxID=1507870 RepID=A0A1V8T753_9PEZI|nr:hypothetical protein B0A48_07749 [Cryoendolithus antarcticus]
MAVWCRTEKLEGLKARDKDNLAYGGKWAMHVVWVGNPPQQLNALVSTSGTKLQLPITPACYGDGSFNATIVLPHRRPPGGIVSSLRDTEQSPHDAADFYTPQGSHTWQPSLECSQGSDILSYVLWYEHEFLNGVYRTLWHLRAPLERLSRSYNAPDAADRNRVASIGLRALATTWHGRPDYWWALMIQSRASLFQSLPYLDIPTRYSQFGPYDREAGLAYVYTAGRWYGSSPATLSIGAVGQWGVDIPQMTRPLPDDGVLALDLVTLELSHRDSSGAGNITIPLLADPVGAVLDSDSPFLELPRSVCFDIADELDLHYIEESGLFVMDTSVIAHLSMLQPSLRFGLGGAGRREIYEDQMPAAQSGARLVIQLPFEALNHTLTYAGHEQLYFPIRIAEENRGIVLGRAIFQEIA